MNVDINHIDIGDLPDHLPPEIARLLEARNGPSFLLMELPRLWEPAQIGPPAGEPKTLEQRLWELIGLYYLRSNRPYEALALLMGLYDHMLLAQELGEYRVHKGMPLLWISECFQAVQFPVHVKRYLMLTLCEDAITYKGEIDPEKTGTYFRVVWHHGLSDAEVQRYSREMFQLFQTSPTLGAYPEWVLQDLDLDWMAEFSNLREASAFHISTRYAQLLIKNLGDPSGKTLERLGSYYLSCIPGFRTTTRRLSRSTDYDIVCSIEGLEIDFRSEIGRYFVCECKDRKDPADFSTVAKFYRVLDSTKCKFGILFSTSGISGKGKGVYAEREQIKVYQDRGLVIVVADRDDLESVANGANFLSLLRDRYEAVRLDLL